MDRARAFGALVQFDVVESDQHAVRGELDIQFDTIKTGSQRAEQGFLTIHRVFALRTQTAVTDQQHASGIRHGTTGQEQREDRVTQDDSEGSMFHVSK